MIENNAIETNYPDNTSSLQAERTDAGQFKKGISGNPKGRPYGVKNKISTVLYETLEKEAPAIISKLIELAKNGDISAIKLILERIYPSPKNKDLYFVLPTISDRKGIDEARTEVQQDFINGKLTVTEAKETMELLNIAEKSNRSVFDIF
jgi:hypothetical protein